MRSSTTTTSLRRLEGLGAVFVESEDEIPAGAICVLSAHGVAPAVKENCERRGLQVVDAVCPLVSKVHAEARRYADSGHLVALVGHATMSRWSGRWASGPSRPSSSSRPRRRARSTTNGKPVAVITQTTLSLDDVAPIVDALGDHVGATLKRPAADDICYATQNRQDAVKEIVSMGASQILVIGSPTSSNAQRLVEVAEARGAQARLIEDEKAIDEAMLARPRDGRRHRRRLDPRGARPGGHRPARRVRVRRARRGHRRPRGRSL